MQALPDIWLSKVSPATEADQLAREIQAILDQSG